MRFLGAVAAALSLSGGSAALQPANPTWTSGGTKIAYANLGGPDGQLVVMKPDGTGKRVIYHADSCCEPVIGATGDRIVFVSNFQLYVIGAGGGTPTPLAVSPRFNTPWFILSPSRETIAFDDGCGCGHSPDSVALVGIRAGSRPFVVPRPKDTSDSIDGFSPDGTQLVFTRGPWSPDGATRGRPLIMVQSVRGGRAVPLARSGLIGSRYVPSNAVWPQWSPDGMWIAFVAPGSKPKLELVSTSDGVPRVLASDVDLSGFSWSPDSLRIAYGFRGNPGRLVTVDLRGTRTVVSGPVNWVSDDSWDRPQWSPDGTKLVFMAQGGGVWIVGVNGAGLHRVA
jgi:Tol biopolymer transport system component